jgi:hypothetical protein
MWPRFINAALGLWLMIAPSIFAYEKSGAEINERIVGPVMITCALIAIWQTSRQARWGCVAAGAWLLVAPWIFGFDAWIILNEMLVGAAAIALGLVRGKMDQRIGGGWPALLSGDTAPS